MKNFLVINEGCSDNIGDQIINSSMSYLLKESNATFLDFTKSASAPTKIQTNFKKNYKSKLKRELRRLIPIKIRWILENITRVKDAANKKYDVVIIGGGQLIISNATFPISMFLWIFYLKLYKQKVIIFGVGSGEKFSLINKYLYKKSLQKVDGIYIRDKKSQEILNNTYKVKTRFVYDVAFMYDKILISDNYKKKPYYAWSNII